MLAPLCKIQHHIGTLLVNDGANFKLPQAHGVRVATGRTQGGELTNLFDL